MMMKSILTNGAVALALFLGISSAHAQIIYSTSFSAAEGYADGVIVGQPANGSVQWENANEAVGVANFQIVNEELSIIGDGTGGKWIKIAIPKQENAFTAEFEGYYVGDGTRVNIGVSFSEAANFELDGNAIPTWNEQGAMVRFANDNLIDVRNGDGAGGGSFTKLADVLYNDGKKFYIRAEVDVYNNRVTVYVHKDGETKETLLAEDYGFRRFTLEVDCITIFDNCSDGSIAGVGLALDNFVLYGSASVPEWALY